MNGAFDQLGKAPAYNIYATLSEISYPTGAKTQYAWDKGTKNLNPNGYMEYFKVKERKEIDAGRILNLLKYQYFGEPDGYPAYKAGATLPSTYEYYTLVSDNRGVTTKYLYNYKHLLTKTQQNSTRLLAETVTQYHDQYKLPIKITSKTYNSQGNFFEKVSQTEYDSKGNVITENTPDKPEEINTDEHKTFITYDPVYNLVVSKRFKQDQNTTVEIKYTLSSDKKTAAAQQTFGNGKILNNAEFSYDEYGNLTQQRVEKEPGEWVTTEFKYGSEYKGAYLTAVINKNVMDADGCEKDIKTSFTYDFATGNQVTATDGNGNTTTFEYDNLDRVLRQIAPDKSSVSYNYNDLSNILEETDANRNKLIYYYDGLGNLKKVVEPIKNITVVEMQYDDYETLVSETDGNRNIKKLSYDEQIRLTGITNYDKAGRMLADTRVKYDEALYERFGDVFFKVSVTKKGDSRDMINNYYFDAFDRLTKMGRYKGGKEEFARYRYDYLDNQLESTDFAGQKSTFQYDALGQLIKSTDPMGSSTKFKYDRLGNMIAQTDAIGRTTEFEYDKLGRKTVVKAPFEVGKSAVTKYYYDNNGNLTRMVDPEGYETKQYFTNRNFLSAVEKLTGPNKSNITKYEYDREGNTTRVIKGLDGWQDPDYSAYTYKYDNLNRLILMADASNRQTFYEYDNNGNLTKLTDRNKVETTYNYDGIDRLVRKQNSKDGKKNAVSITFNKLGQTRQMTDESGTTVFDYDELGRLTNINYGNGIRQKYAYDNADRVSNLLVMQGSMKHINLNYEYDKVGRLTAVRDNGRKFGYNYNAIGQLLGETNGVTGIKSSYQYYPSGNIRNLRHWNGKNIVANYEYKYDMRGNQTEKVEGDKTTKYYYDALSRIKTAMLPDNKLQNYEYDDLDNIKELTEIKGNSIKETKYLYDRDNRLLLQDTQSGLEKTERRFSYDANGNQLTKDEAVKRNGNLVSSKTFNYWYDGFNQLKRVQNPDNQFIDYTYNGEGLRTKKEFGDKTVNYYYNGGNIILETDKDQKVTARNIRGLHLIYRENNPGQTDSQYLYYLHNAHGDVTKLLNEKGEIIKDYEYDPFGKEEMPENKVFGRKRTTEMWRQEVEKIDNPFKYCGEYQDEETGNYYLRARYYDPSVQRFINEDSYAVALGAAWKDHLYSYANNNPIVFTDPSGHFGESFTRWCAGWGSSVGKSLTNNVAKPVAKTLTPVAKKAASAGSAVGKSLTEHVAKPVAKTLTPVAKKADKIGSSAGKAINKAVQKVVNPTKNDNKNNIKDKGKTGQKVITNTANKNAVPAREAAKSGAIDAGGYAIDSAIEEIGKAFGKKVLSPLGTATSGVLTGMDVSDTLDNKKYTTGQKITKVTIQVVGGGVNVAFGTAVGGLAVGAAPETGGASIVGGAAVIGGFSYGVNRTQNWLYGKLGLQ